jgi:hypothetical protein
MPVNLRLDLRSGPSGHTDRIEALEPLRRSLGEVRETADQFDQAQALLRAIERFADAHAAGQENAGASAGLARRDDRCAARGRLLVRALRGQRRTVLAAKAAASCR